MAALSITFSWRHSRSPSFGGTHASFNSLGTLLPLSIPFWWCPHFLSLGRHCAGEECQVGRRRRPHSPCVKSAAAGRVPSPCPFFLFSCQYTGWRYDVCEKANFLLLAALFFRRSHQNWMNCGIPFMLQGGWDVVRSPKNAEEQEQEGRHQKQRKTRNTKRKTNS